MAYDDNDDRVQWFGESWGAPICNESKQAATPVGDSCAQCSKPIGADDAGLLILHYDGQKAGRLPYHLMCFLRTLGVMTEGNA